MTAQEAIEQSSRGALLACVLSVFLSTIDSVFLGYSIAHFCTPALYRCHIVELMINTERGCRRRGIVAS